MQSREQEEREELLRRARVTGSQHASMQAPDYPIPQHSQAHSGQDSGEQLPNGIYVPESTATLDISRQGAAPIAGFACVVCGCARRRSALADQGLNSQFDLHLETVCLMLTRLPPTHVEEAMYPQSCIQQ